MSSWKIWKSTKKKTLKGVGHFKFFFGVDCKNSMTMYM